MILVTGGAGFIGSVLVWRLNGSGRQDIVVADHFAHGDKWQNLAKRQLSHVLTKEDLPGWLSGKARAIDAVVHMGACSATTETNVDYLVRNNFQYSVDLFEYCARERIPMIYASSAATYGQGEQGYKDDPISPDSLRPVNAYGFSKNVFDQWVVRQKKTPPFWAGIKFFNVYGPQEYHKGPQASVAYHAFHQITQNARLKLFKSYREGVAHGDQRRDFVYVKDVVDFMVHLLTERRNIPSGLYNAGTGTARSFGDLGRAVFQAMGHDKESFEWIEMPQEMRSRYQYFTEADTSRIRTVAGYDKAFHTLEQGVSDYVKGYLSTSDPYL